MIIFCECHGLPHGKGRFLNQTGGAPKCERTNGTAVEQYPVEPGEEGSEHWHQVDAGVPLAESTVKLGSHMQSDLGPQTKAS